MSDADTAGAADSMSEDCRRAWAERHEKALSYLAHELQQPLTAVQMLIDTMQADPTRPVGELSEECELISRQVFLMAEKIEQAREAARTELELNDEGKSAGST